MGDIHSACSSQQVPQAPRLAHASLRMHSQCVGVLGRRECVAHRLPRLAASGRGCRLRTFRTFRTRVYARLTGSTPVVAPESRQKAGLQTLTSRTASTWAARMSTGSISNSTSPGRSWRSRAPIPRRIWKRSSAPSSTTTSTPMASSISSSKPVPRTLTSPAPPTSCSGS